MEERCCSEKHQHQNSYMKRTIVYAFALFCLTGCQDLAVKKNVIGNYYLTAADVPDGTCLSYHTSKDDPIYSWLIGPTVFAVGYNNDFMIIKQHPSTFPYAPDKKVTNYYILPIKKEMDWQTKNGLLGPMTLEHFNNTRKELNIPDGVTFTIVMKDLE